MKKWAVLRDLNNDVLTNILTTTQHLQHAASYKENGNDAEATEYEKLFQADKIALEKSFENTFCNYESRLDPLMEFISLMVPSHNETLIQRSQGSRDKF